MRGGILKPDIVSDFKFRSKMHVGAELRKESIERVYALPDFIFRPTNASKNVWRPG